MTGYKVSFDQDCIVDERDEGTGNWDHSYHQEYENRLEDVSRNPKYPDIVSEHYFKEGEIAYVVWVECSTGDSFGHSSRSGVEAVGIFKEREVAEELVKHIGGHKPDRDVADWKDKYQLECETSDGQKFKIYTGSWHDYFGGLDEVHIDSVIVK